MMTTSEFKVGQIWIAYVYFIDYPQIGKVRPVVIVNAEEILSVSVCRVTSRVLADPSDIFIKEWQSCGLIKPSYIRPDIVFEIPRTDILSDNPIGEIDKSTLAQVLETIKTTM